MSYCQGNLQGWFDDLLQAGERVATSAIRQSTPVGYGTQATPPMFPPTYGAPAPSTMNLAPAALEAMLPYIIVSGVVLWFLMSKRR